MNILGGVSIDILDYGNYCSFNINIGCPYNFSKTLTTITKQIRISLFCHLDGWTRATSPVCNLRYGPTEYSLISPVLISCNFFFPLFLRRNWVSESSKSCESSLRIGIMRRAFSISGLRFLGPVRGPISNYSRFNVLRSYCQTLHLSQTSPSGFSCSLSLSLYIYIFIYLYVYTYKKNL